MGAETIALLKVLALVYILVSHQELQFLHTALRSQLCSEAGLSPRAKSYHHPRKEELWGSKVTKGRLILEAHLIFHSFKVLDERLIQ